MQGIKYSDIVNQTDAGTVTLEGNQIQLCDYVEQFENEYFATALCHDDKALNLLEKAGLKTRKFSQDFGVVWIPHKILSKVDFDKKNTYTADLLSRLKDALVPLNNQTAIHRAA